MAKQCPSATRGHAKTLLIIQQVIQQFLTCFASSHISIYLLLCTHSFHRNASNTVTNSSHSQIRIWDAVSLMYAKYQTIRGSATTLITEAATNKHHNLKSCGNGVSLLLASIQMSRNLAIKTSHIGKRGGLSLTIFSE